MTILSVTNLPAQNWYLNQVIVGSGGNFSDPDDFVTIASYSPETGNTTVFDTIYTQSIQDIVVADGMAWVAAQDSIVKYNLDSYTRLAAVSAPGVNQLNVNGEILIASFWYPVTEDFVKTYNANDLSEIFAFSDVSDEAAGIFNMNETTAIVAVPGSWMSTVGKLAWINLTDNTSMEVDFGTSGVGINQVFRYETPVPNYAAITNTPWGDTTFSLLTFEATGNHTGNYSFEGSNSGFIGINQSKALLKLDGGIGILDLENMELNSSLLVKPGDLTIAGSDFDTVNNHLYVAATDYFSTGEGSIYNIDGDVIGTFEAGISPDAVGLDYRNSSNIYKPDQLQVKVYPNPATDILKISGKFENNTQIFVLDIMGNNIMNLVSGNSNQIAIDVQNLEEGLYFLNVGGNKTIPFIKL